MELLTNVSQTPALLVLKGADASMRAPAHTWAGLRRNRKIKVFECCTWLEFVNQNNESDHSKSNEGKRNRYGTKFLNS